VQSLHLAALTALTVAAAWALQRVKGPSPWIFAPLFVTGGLHVSGVPLSALPPWVTPAGQVLLAVSLGAGFKPDIVRAAPRWVMSVVGGTLLILALGGLMAVGAAALTHGDWRSVVLGTSPGGMAEMCLTAEVLHLGVPFVTACHLARTVTLMTLSGWLYRRWRGGGPPVSPPAASR
jgi:membrane AbrB-like protein